MSAEEPARLTLCLVTPRVVRGDGQGRVNYEIVRYALARGAGTTIVATEIDPEFAKHPRVQFVRGGIARLPTSLLRSQVFSLQSGRWLKRNRERFEVLHTNGSVTLAASDVNTAHFIHAAWATSQAHPSRYDRGAYGLYHRLLSAIHSAQERVAYRRARHVVAISGAVAEQLVRIGVAADNISVIYNGVDTHEFAPGEPSRSALGLPQDGFLALFAGDMTTPRKNLETVLEALREVPNVHLVVVGALRKNPYPARAAAMGLADRVTFLGWRRDLPKIMQSVDAFVYPSLYEPLGLVVLEALACGLPIVTVKATGASELIGAECGFVIDDARDHRALAAALARLVADPELRRSMGLAARATAERHTWEAMSKQYYELYERLARVPPRSA